ncbi:MAG: response regulator [Actinomycetota bacterium]|nr:response regulator [Actinomycetota bacterium]
MTKVLLATDADWVADDVDAALGDTETEMHRVRRGLDVLPAVQQLQPDLVVLDLQIGNMGGVAASLALRQEEDEDRIDTVAILILLDRMADVFMAQTARADGWMVKPLDAFRLRRAANTVLEGGTWYEGFEERAPTG